MQASVDAWAVWMGAWFASFWETQDLPALRQVIRLYDQVERVVLHRPIPVDEHLRELVSGVDVQQRIRDVPEERLLRKPDQDV